MANREIPIEKSHLRNKDVTAIGKLKGVYFGDLLQLNAMRYQRDIFTNCKVNRCGMLYI